MVLMERGRCQQGVVNALRQVPQFLEIAVHLQSNEVWLHAPVDVDLGAAFEAIREAGYTPDSKVWLPAYGTWGDEGSSPREWNGPLSVPATSRPETTTAHWSICEICRLLADSDMPRATPLIFIFRWWNSARARWAGS